MRPLLLQGHERPLTFVKYNKDGDLLFTCAKDHTPCVFFSDDGDRVGTYKGHNGVVWTCDITRDSRHLMTSSADQTIRIWDTATGTQLTQFKYEQPARACSFAEGGREIVLTTDPFMGAQSTIQIIPLTSDLSNQGQTARLTMGEGVVGRINRCLWGPLNKTIITTGEDGNIRQWCTKTGELLKCVEAHKKGITDLKMTADKTHMITTSLDKSAKLWDVDTLEQLKNYETERPVQTADISPLFDHVILGGGQDASQVTTTSSKAAGFQTKFIHKVLEHEFGGVKGHFGPVNSLAFSPDGRSFTSGGEDGYVRVHHFDADYFKTKY
eukprot:CAMPEP_0182864750 /NCGR_PEP_ID=MMETSP0034_2-20130328/7326_1 /TAXON_ID=156128 /ORGANISM="Nephroselmis pyriformis, Strain CCMP717" /LENGTH=324 /DNA_ID=CAMNT_0024997013 /DNA_START=70 /DNA_END=1044 /DNA_ORIENTATION=+